MSDTIKKWHEMQEEKEYAEKIKALEKSNQSATSPGTFIYESPDGGETVTRRPFGGDIEDREVIKKPEISKDVKKDAYTILSVYSEDSIRLAAKILNVGE